VSLIVETRIGKKYTVYLPKAVVEAVGIREGQKVLLRAEGSTIKIESLADPLELGLLGKKFASVKPEQIEAISIEEQARQAEGSD